MLSIPMFFISIFLVLNHLIILASSQESPWFHYCLSDNFTANSIYSSNLNNLVSNFSSLRSNDYGFYNMSVGQNSDQVNGIALCRGDIKPDACLTCIETAAKELTDTTCPRNKEAVIWYDSCMFRYSNNTIVGKKEDGNLFYLWNPQNATDIENFNKALRDLLDKLRARAAAGGSQKKYATGNITGPAFQTVYGLVQCTPDLTEQDCNDCLVNIFAHIPACCGGKRGGRTVGPSCNFRYEIGRFYDPQADPGPAAPPPSASNTPPPPPSDETLSINGTPSVPPTTIIAIVVPVVAIILLAICLCVFLKRRKKKPTKRRDDVDGISNTESLQYDFDTIKVATDNFSEANKLGQGGFGAVYKGRLEDEQEIAVKRLGKNSGQGDVEFKNEVVLVAKLQHRNLVRLLGFCMQGSEKLLVYEFVPNASLDQFIFDPIKSTLLDWDRRYKIIGGVARGVLYLHEDSRLRIIHRDLKASNILLDEDMAPKIADFGMARLFKMDQTQGDTSRIVGTYGYMAPEYAMHGQFSVKTDVFSFGVLVLEIVSGQKNNCFRNGEKVEDLLGYAWKSWKDGTILNIVDRSLTSGSSTEMMRCIHIGLLCVQENVVHRPTMANVVLMLNSYSITLPSPTQPAFFMHSSIESDTSSSIDYYSNSTTYSGSKSEALPLSKNEVSISELYPR